MENFLDLPKGLRIHYKVNKVHQAKANVLINHGFAEHLGRYDYVTEFLNKNSYSVFRYDLRGHGKTGFKRGHIDSFKDFIDDCDTMVNFIKSDNNKDIFILGHSMGGLVTSLYGVDHPNEISGQILSGPAVDFLPVAKGPKGGFLRLLKKINKNIKIKNVVEDDICSVEEVVDKYKSDPLVLKEASLNLYYEFLFEGISYLRKNIKNYTYPCLILHGGDDKIVPPRASESFYEEISSLDKERLVYNGLYHEILNELSRDEILNKIVDWLDYRVNSEDN